MADTTLMDEIFNPEDDEPASEEYVIVAVFKSQYKGQCNLDDSHFYKFGDFVGKLERTDNPFLPVSGVCCNRCVRITTHKKSLE